MKINDLFDYALVGLFSVLALPIAVMVLPFVAIGWSLDRLGLVSIKD
jgi:hypothetical protein